MKEQDRCKEEGTVGQEQESLERTEQFIGRTRKKDSWHYSGELAVSDGRTGVLAGVITSTEHVSIVVMLILTPYLDTRGSDLRRMDGNITVRSITC